MLGKTPRLADDLQLVFWDLRAYQRELRERIGADGVRELRRRALADRTVPAMLNAAPGARQERASASGDRGASESLAGTSVREPGIPARSERRMSRSDDPLQRRFSAAVGL